MHLFEIEQFPSFLSEILFLEEIPTIIHSVDEIC